MNEYIIFFHLSACLEAVQCHVVCCAWEGAWGHYKGLGGFSTHTQPNGWVKLHENILKYIIMLPHIKFHSLRVCA